MEDEYPPLNAYLDKPFKITDGITLNYVFYNEWSSAQTVLLIDEETTRNRQRLLPFHERTVHNLH